MLREFRLSLFGVLLGLVYCFRLEATPATERSSSACTFTNPIVLSGQDPWVIQYSNHYYFCQSVRRSIRVAKADELQHIGDGPWATVWAPSPDTAYSKDLWAPELHYLRGGWYIYLAADDGENRNHRIYVLQGTTQDPQSAFTFKGHLVTRPDRWAIDGTVLQMPGDKLYFIWSGWEGTENVAQNLYIAPMSDPLTISGERVCISKPEREWELHGRPLINEGPETLWHGTNLFLIYSASGSWGDDYCLGQLTWTGGDVLNPASWSKKSDPVFSRTAAVFGPGHCSFVKSPDGREDWIVYHSAKHKGAGWNRQVSIERFYWNVDGSPNFGSPIPPGVPIPCPK